MKTYNGVIRHLRLPTIVLFAFLLCSVVAQAQSLTITPFVYTGANGIDSITSSSTKGAFVTLLALGPGFVVAIQYTFTSTAGASRFNKILLYQDDGDSAFDSSQDTLITSDSVILNASVSLFTSFSSGTYFIVISSSSTPPSASDTAQLDITSMAGADITPFSTGDQSLPVELASFSGNPTRDSVVLRWRTESETNNLGFRVYRSANKDGKFEKVAFVDGHGNTPIPHDYTFTDKKVKGGETYYYFLEDIDIAGNTERSGIITVTFPRMLSKAVPTQFVLRQNFPNPFNPETWIPYELAQASYVSITIFNARWHSVQTLNLGQQSPGYYTQRHRAAYWDGRSDTGEFVSSGVYFYRLETESSSAIRKMVILR